MLAIEDAIHTELVNASGLAGARIIYEHQNRDALGKSGASREFMTVGFGDLKDLAPATPSVTVRDNPSPSAGAEILLGVSSDSEFTVRVTFYAGPTTGTGSAYSRLRDIVKKLALDAATARLQAVSIAFVECSNGVRSVPTVVDTEFESRAVADLRFRTVDGVEVAETYIQTAEFVGTYT